MTEYPDGFKQMAFHRGHWTPVQWSARTQRFHMILIGNLRLPKDCTLFAPME